jgi:RNA polymerase sigma-70 factor (ECF subfamily)
MLGSVAAAEDVVQDAYLRWHAADRIKVHNPRAFLNRTVTRLCLDHLKSARSQRERYIGPWLPEPLVEPDTAPPPTAEDLAADVSMALMVALERLSPLERAAFLLHDVFALDFAAIAEALDRSEPACRQLASRARDHVRAARPRFKPAPADHARLIAAFTDAVASSDAAALTRLLREDATLHTDGGGKVQAALNPITGREKIIRFLIAQASALSHLQLSPARVNGLPGLIARSPTGRRDVIAFDVRDGALANIYVVANPDKLTHVP